MGTKKKTFFKDIQHTNFKHLEQTRLTADSVNSVTQVKA